MHSFKGVVILQPPLSPPLLDFPYIFRHLKPIFKLCELLVELHLPNPPPPRYCLHNAVYPRLQLGYPCISQDDPRFSTQL